MPRPRTSRSYTRGMRTAIRNTLRLIASNPSVQQSLKNAGYIYCAYISTLLVEAIWSIPVQRVTIGNSAPNGSFKFPMGRSNIYNQSASWYDIETRNGKDWELHLCCECAGVSGHLHELDIVLLTKTTADTCRAQRRQRRNPQTSEVAFLAECKNVGNLEYEVGRAFLGLCWEFPSQDWLHSWPHHWVWRGQPNLKLGALVGTLHNISAQNSAFALVDARDLIARQSVEPRQQTTNVAQFKQDIRSALAAVLV